MQATLLGGPQGRLELGASDITIGRTPDNVIILTGDGKVSGHHAVIRPTNDGYYVIDVGSTNGTFVNERRLERNVPCQLYHNDSVRVGDTRFTYDAPNAGIPPTVFAEQGEIPPTVAAQMPPINKTVAAANPFENKAAYPDVPVLPNFANNRVAQRPQQQQPPPFYPGPVGQQPPPKKRSRRGLWITLIVVVLLILGAFFIVPGLLHHSTPEQTMTTFCNDLVNKDYHDAYQQLSTAAQGRVSEDKFTQEVSGGFGRAGGLDTCSFDPNPVNKTDTNNAATTMLWKVAALPQPIPASTRLILENSTWKIDGIRPQVQGAPSV